MVGEKAVQRCGGSRLRGLRLQFETKTQMRVANQTDAKANANADTNADLCSSCITYPQAHCRHSTPYPHTDAVTDFLGTIKRANQKLHSWMG